MEEIEIKCYLCDFPAKIDKIDGARNKIVHCSHCINRYKITDMAIKFLKDLEAPERYKVHEFVYNDHIIEITVDMVKQKTGKS